MTYENIFKTLNALGIDYVVVGGLAINFLGIPRMTYDIDIVINLENEKIMNKEPESEFSMEKIFAIQQGSWLIRFSRLV